MKHVTMLGFLVLVSSACAPNYGPVHIDNFYPGNGCAIPKTADPFMIRGELDVVGGAEFYLGVIMTSLMGSGGNAGELVVNTTVLETAGTPGHDAPIMDSVFVTYSSKPKLSGFKDFTIPIRAGFDDQGLAAVSAFNIIGPETAAALGAVQQDTDVELTASIEFRGYMRRQGNRITTGPNAFPIHVYRSNISCGSYRKGFSCNYPGQARESLSAQYCCDGIGGCGTFGMTSCYGVEGCF